MQILEIYIHTIHIHSYTYIYNFFHHHHHHHHHNPPPPTPPTPQGGGGYWYIHMHTYTTSSTTTTHHHPHHPHHPHHRGEGVHHHPPPPTPQGGGGYWGATIQTHNHGVGGGVPSDAGPYIYIYYIYTLDPPKIVKVQPPRSIFGWFFGAQISDRWRIQGVHLGGCYGSHLFQHMLITCW